MVQPTPENVIERLRRRTNAAQQLGFKIRGEWLDGQQATWCEIAGAKVLFVDLGLTAAEQLDQIERTLQEYQQECLKRNRHRHVA